MANPNPTCSFEPGNSVGVQFDDNNRAAIKHGARSAELALRDGQPFVGLAQEALAGVVADLGIDPDNLPPGITRVILGTAARIEATSRLCSSAAAYHAAAGNLEGWTRYSRLATHHGRTAAGLLRDLAADLDNGASIIDAALASAKGAGGE